MKFAGPVLILLLATALTASAQLSPAPSPEAVKLATEPTSPTKPSPAIAKELADQMPKFIQPLPASPTAAATTTVAPAAQSDPNTLQLNKVTVTPRKRPRLNDDVMMTTKAYNEKLAHEKLSSFDRNFLNKYSLPSWFGGVSAAERAREEHDREVRVQTTTDTLNLAKVVEISDPEQAKVLRDAINRP